MSFFNRLFGRGRQDATPVNPMTAAPQPRPIPSPAETVADPATAAAPPPDTGRRGPSTSDLLRDVASRMQGGEVHPDIWEVPGAPDGAQAEEHPAEEAAPRGRPARNRTRLLGFDTSEGDAVDIMGALGAEQEEAEAAPTLEAVRFPVGWVVVVEGPGRGAHFPLVSGLSSIGRGAEQSVRLDFGDKAISRAGHAAIVYDAETRRFTLGQGGKSNIVRLNGSPVIANETLSDGDRIRLGETELRLSVLCGQDFDWAEALEDGGDEDDLEIA